MFTSGMKESTSEDIVIHDTPVAAFQALLVYIYHGKVDLPEATMDDVLDILAVAHRYQIDTLVTEIAEKLQSTLKNDNVLSRYELASLYNLKTLEEACMKIIVSETDKILVDESFLKASEVSDHDHRNSSLSDFLKGPQVIKTTQF